MCRKDCEKQAAGSKNHTAARSRPASVRAFVRDHSASAGNGQRIAHLARGIRRVDEAQGLGRARLSALAVLHFGGVRSLSDLANAELVTPATMHHIVKGLISEKLVARKLDESDARRQLIRLTPKGRSVIVRAHRARIDYLMAVSADVDVAALTQMAETLNALTQAANQMRNQTLTGS